MLSFWDEDKSVPCFDSVGPFWDNPRWGRDMTSSCLQLLTNLMNTPSSEKRAVAPKKKTRETGATHRWRSPRRQLSTAQRWGRGFTAKRIPLPTHRASLADISLTGGLTMRPCPSPRSWGGGKRNRPLERGSLVVVLHKIIPISEEENSMVRGKH